MKEIIDPKKLNEKVAVVTGASSGIGRSLLHFLQHEDKFEHVLGLSRRGPDLYKDVAKIASVESPFVPTCDLLINCAGIMPFKEGRATMDTNFWGTYKMIQNLMPVFSKGACIINIASVSGMMAEPDLPIYAASKAAVISLTRSLAKKLAPDIRVNCISPGYIVSDLVEGETPKELIDTIPMGYEETPSRLFAFVKTLYETNYITGSNFVIDGGVSL